MATNLTFAGTTIAFPQQNDAPGWGTNLNSWATNINDYAMSQLGDFSNSTLSSRQYLQTITTNQLTSVPVIPNGTSTQAEIGFYSSSTYTTPSVFYVGTNGTTSYINSTTIGGTSLPINVYVGGSNVATFTSAGLFALSNPTSNLQVATKNYVDINLGATSVIANTSANATYYPIFVSATTGTLPLYTGSITFNPSTGNITSTTFTGALSGNATTATTTSNIAGGSAGNIVYQSGASTTTTLAAGTNTQVLISGTTPSWTNISGLSVASATNSTNATNATNVAATNSTSNTTYDVPFLSAATGNVGVLSNSGLTFNPSTGLLSTPNTTLSGALVVGTTSTMNGVLVVNAGAYTTKVILTYGTTTTVNCYLSNAFRVVLTGNITTFTINNPSDGQTINIRFKQDGTGSRTIAWPSSFRWNGGSVPVLSTGANNLDFLSAQYDATDGTWVASLMKGVQ